MRRSHYQTHSDNQNTRTRTNRKKHSQHKTHCKKNAKRTHFSHARVCLATSQSASSSSNRRSHVLYTIWQRWRTNAQCKMRIVAGHIIPARQHRAAPPLRSIYSIYITLHKIVCTSAPYDHVTQKPAAVFCEQQFNVKVHWLTDTHTHTRRWHKPKEIPPDLQRPSTLFPFPAVVLGYQHFCT